MKVAFNITLDDQMAFQKYYLDSIHFFSKVKFYNVVLLGVMTLFFAFYNFSGFEIDYIRIGIMGAIFIVFSVIFLFTYEKRILKNIRDTFKKQGNSLFTGYTTIDLSDEVLKVIKKGFKHEYQRGTFLKFRENKDYIFIFNSEMSAYIIPKNQISSQKLHDLENILENKIKDLN